MNHRAGFGIFQTPSCASSPRSPSSRSTRILCPSPGGLASEQPHSGRPCVVEDEQIAGAQLRRQAFDDRVGKAAGFSLQAGVAARADQRQKLERCVGMSAGPAISEKRLSLTPNGKVR